MRSMYACNMSIFLPNGPAEVPCEFFWHDFWVEFWEVNCLGMSFSGGLLCWRKSRIKKSTQEFGSKILVSKICFPEFGTKLFGFWGCKIPVQTFVPEVLHYIQIKGKCTKRHKANHKTNTAPAPPPKKKARIGGSGWEVLGGGGVDEVGVNCSILLLFFIYTCNRSIYIFENNLRRKV